MTLHKAIIRQGSALLDKASIRPLRTFRFATMREGPDLRLFCHPSTLSRLALWLVDVTRDRWAEKDARQGKSAKSLPFVIACLNEDTGAYLVVGVTGSPEFGDVRKKWVLSLLHFVPLLLFFTLVFFTFWTCKQGGAALTRQ
jgi:cell division control protein 45